MVTDNGVSRRAVLAGIGGSGLIGGIGIAGAESETDGGGSEDAVYVVLGGGHGLQRRVESAGFSIRHELADGSVLIVRGPPERADELESLSVVVSVIANEAYAVDGLEQPVAADAEPQYDRQWDKQLLRAPTAHERATGDGTTLAVVDSGISHAHPELASRLDVERGRAFENGRIRAGTGDVAVADAPPMNGAAPTRSATRHVADDVGGHGSHVAGIAAASRDGTGIVGMAPDATLISLRALSFVDLLGRGEIEYLIATPADILLAIDYAAEIGVDVVNVSLESAVPGNSRLFAAYRRVVQHALERGTVVVAAAGNSGYDLNSHPDYVLPADAPGPITVAATGPNDERVYNSNYGNGTVDVAAPGGGYETRRKTVTTDPAAVDYPAPTNHVYSTVPDSIYGSRYAYNFGTSMAAPQVAGLACQLRELVPDLHPRRVEQAIAQSAVGRSEATTSGLGAGRIDAPDALDRIADRR